MTKNNRVIWIVAAACIIVGTLISVITLLTLGNDPLQWDTNDYVTNNYTIEEPFRAIRTEHTISSDLRILPSMDDSCRVMCYDQQKLTHSAAVENGTLVIRKQDDRRWYDHIGIQLQSTEILIYLPQREYESLTVQSSAGDVTVEPEFTFSTVDILTNTGDIQLSAQVTQALNISTDTGDTKIEHATPHSLSADSSTGDIAILSATVTDGIRIETDTGKVKLSDTQCAHMTMESNTGDIFCQNVNITDLLQIETDSGDVALTDTQCGALLTMTTTGDLTCRAMLVQGHLAIETDAGDVTFYDCDAATLSIQTDTGDVSGSLLSEKLFHIETDTGTVHVPHSTSGGICEIRTDTGDIELTVK